MALEHVGYIDLPLHAKPGGFDHAAVHSGRGLLYVAHTANDAVDVIDCTTHKYLRSIPHLTQVAGALVSETHDLVFTSNRGEDTVGIFSPSQETVAKVKVECRPNGLAYGRRSPTPVAANVGDPSRPGSFTLSLVDVGTRTVIASIPVSGRTRWTVFDDESGRFYVNIADPPQIVGDRQRRPPTRLAAFSRCGRWALMGWISIRQGGVSSARATARRLLVVDAQSGAVQSRACDQRRAGRRLP